MELLATGCKFWKTLLIVPKNSISLTQCDMWRNVSSMAGRAGFLLVPYYRFLLYLLLWALALHASHTGLLPVLEHTGQPAAPEPLHCCSSPLPTWILPLTSIRLAFPHLQVVWLQFPFPPSPFPASFLERFTTCSASCPKCTTKLSLLPRFQRQTVHWRLAHFLLVLLAWKTKSVSL